MSEDAVIVGRFQPLHKGHKEDLIDYALEEYDEVCLGIGVAGDEPTDHDPLLYEEREEVISAVYEDLAIVPVHDQGDNDAWVREVEDQVGEYLSDDVIPVTGNDWTAECFEEYDDTDYDVDFLEEEEMTDRDRYRGTNVRELARDGEDWRHLVPDPAEEILDDIGFEQRVADLD